MRSEIAANLNVLEFVKIFGEICKTLGVRWSNRYGVTAPLCCGKVVLYTTFTQHCGDVVSLHNVVTT